MDSYCLVLNLNGDALADPSTMWYVVVTLLPMETRTDTQCLCLRTELYSDEFIPWTLTQITF